MHRLTTAQFVHRHGFDFPLDPLRAQRLPLKGVTRHPVGRLRHPDTPGRCHLLHASGQIGRIPLRCIVHAQIIPNATHHHRARVQTEPHLKRHAPLPLYGFTVFSQGRLYIQGGM